MEDVPIMDGSERCVCHESFRYVRTQLTHTHTQTHAQTQAKHSSQVRIHTRTINKPLAFLSQDFKGAHTHKQDTITQDTNTHTHRHKHRHRHTRRQTYNHRYTTYTQCDSNQMPSSTLNTRTTHARTQYKHTFTHRNHVKVAHHKSHTPTPPSPHTSVIPIKRRQGCTKLRILVIIQQLHQLHIASGAT